jgi:hypothetical protein
MEHPEGKKFSELKNIIIKIRNFINIFEDENRTKQQRNRK